MFLAAFVLLTYACTAQSRALGLGSAIADGGGNVIFNGRVSRQLNMEMGRIVGGSDAGRGEFPFAVSLRGRLDNHFCGGALVKPNLVVTAAHCVDSNQDMGIPHPDVLVGGLDLNNDPDAQQFSVCRQILHPKWDGNVRRGFDIALLVLNASSTLKQIQFEKKVPVENGDRVTAMGWGATRFGAFSNTLQKADALEFLPASACNRQGLWNGTLSESMICALNTVQDACFGDSGGPLVTQSRNPRLLGVVSFGDRDCTDGIRPAVYTNIADFVDFIDMLGGPDGISSENLESSEGCTESVQLLESQLGTPLPPNAPMETAEPSNVPNPQKDDPNDTSQPGPNEAGSPSPMPVPSDMATNSTPEGMEMTPPSTQEANNPGSPSGNSSTPLEPDMASSPAPDTKPKPSPQPKPKDKKVTAGAILKRIRKEDPEGAAELIKQAVDAGRSDVVTEAIEQAGGNFEIVFTAFRSLSIAINDLGVPSGSVRNAIRALGGGL